MNKFLQWTEQPETITGLDGKDYEIRPLTLKEWGDFVRWCQYKPYRDAIVAELPEEKLEEIYKRCETGKVNERVLLEDTVGEPDERDIEEQLIDISLSSSYVRQVMQSIEGIEKIIKMSLVNKEAEIIKIAGVENLGEIHRKIFIINGFIDDEESEEDSKKNPDQN